MKIRFLLLFPEAGCEEPVEGDSGQTHGWTKRLPGTHSYALEFKDAAAFNAAAKDGAMRGANWKIPVPSILIEESSGEKFFEPNMVAMQAALEGLGQYVGYTDAGEVVIADKAPEPPTAPVVDPVIEGGEPTNADEPEAEDKSPAFIVEPADVAALNKRVTEGPKIRMGDCAKEGGVSKEHMAALLNDPACKVLMASGGWLQLKTSEAAPPESSQPQ